MYGVVEWMSVWSCLEGEDSPAALGTPFCSAYLASSSAPSRWNARAGTPCASCGRLYPHASALDRVSGVVYRQSHRVGSADWAAGGQWNQTDRASPLSQ